MRAYASSHASPRLVSEGFYTRSGSRGVTLIDTVVASGLMLLVFTGIVGVFRLSVDVVSNNKARAGAIALADERMEYIRSLSYSSIGTVGGIPAGTIPQSESVSLNGISYTRRVLIQYGDDPLDGLGASDTNSIPQDYKLAKVEIAWSSRTGARSIQLVTRIEPPNGIETACPPSAPCGTLTVNVLNAASQPVASAEVHIVNTSTTPVIDITTFTNTSGVVSFVGAPVASNYQITATKSGYSTDQTYNISNPMLGPQNVVANQTTSVTLRIDLLSSMTINTYSLTTNNWTDSFTDESKINPVTSYYIEIAGNQARFEGNQPWTGPASLRSQTITPVALSRWGVFSWNDTRPSLTTITYHVYYQNGESAAPVPDSALPGNSTGFSTGTSVDLSVIPADLYPSLILEAYLVAQDPNAPSPSIQDWSLTYQSGQGIAIPFTMQGDPELGKKISYGPPVVYKYSQLLTTNSSGTLSIPTIEWDTYAMTVAASTGYDIASSCQPQPIVLAPNTAVTTQLYLSPHTSNSLLVDVKNSAGMYLAGAAVRVTKGGSYDKTITTDACGQAFFGSLTNGNYSVTVSKAGYQTYGPSDINVSGASRSSPVLN